ncbi:MAG: response regulator [Candidatus Omnitrophica bacterium]|nr:response regulator [Candidatus Omnitrophota bacterium]
MLSLLVDLGVKQYIREIVKFHEIKLISEIGNHIERTIFSALAHTKTLANNPVLISDESLMEDKLYEMQKIQDFYQLFEGISLLNTKGVVLASTSYDYSGMWEQKEWFVKAKSGQASVSPPHVALSPFRLVLVACAPIFDKQGKVKAVISGQLNVNIIKDLIGNLQMNKQSEGIFLIDREGNLIVHWDEKKLLFKLEPEILKNQLLIGNTGIFEFKDENNIEKVCIFAPLKGYKDYFSQGWIIGYLQNSSSIFAFLAKVKRDIFFAALLGIFLILGSSSVLTSAIVKPVKKLSQASEKISNGIWDVSAPAAGKDEIADLGRMFNHMKEQLKTAQDTSIAQKEQLAVTLRSIGDAVITIDMSGRIILMNEAAENLCAISQKQYEGKIFEEVFQLLDEQTRVVQADFIKKGFNNELLKGQNFVLIANARELKVMHSMALIRDRNEHIVGAVIVLKDVTEEEKLRVELVKVQKLETIGILAGGLAHDFNNILTSIVGSLSIAKLRINPDKDKDLSELINEAEKASFEAKQLTRQLLVFSKGGAPVKQVFKLNDMLEKSVNFVLRGSSCRSIVNIPEDLWLVEIDVGQIKQVVNNLVINAVQAMPKGGCIYVGAKNFVFDKKTIHPLKEGIYVVISIRDEGIGIAPENIEKIFDPFFTTKSDGNGLGLASAYSIIKKHGGYISVNSTLGQGTVFEVYLPAVINKRLPGDEKEGNIIMGRGRILIMDDEEAIRKILSFLLKEVGYEFEFAENGDQAIKLFEDAHTQNNKFDAVILDLTIKGGMGGKDVIKKLLEKDPNVKAIVSSGYANDPIMANYKEYGFSGVLEKPFRLDDLTKTLNDVIAK